MSDEYQSIPVAVARAAVQASGELEGIEGPHYLAHDEAEWLPYFTASQSAAGHPILARAIVTRRGQKPREVVIAWDEYAEQMDADPEWDALRASKPMSIFGAEVERHAYRVAFADVIATAVPLRAVVGAVEPWAATQTPVTRGEVPSRDWVAEVKAADAVALNGLYDEARDAGALVSVSGLQQAFTDRMLQLAAQANAAPSKVAPQTVAPLTVSDRRPEPPRPKGQGNRRRRGPRENKS